MSYKIGFLSDTHLGYSARCRPDANSGINMRVVDGFRGFRQTVDQMIDEEVDAVVHGGDLFHRSAPGVGEIAWARRQLERFATAGIPVFANTGNHDFANERGKSPATAAVNDPDRNIFMVTDPYQVFNVDDGLAIHMVSHVGLMGSNDRPDLVPTPGIVNIFSSHGAAQVPGHEIFACVDSPGEAVISREFLDLPWHATLLGHYHGMGPLPGFSTGDRGQAWYAGSLLRRGFSDPEGGRGWLLVTVNDDSSVTIERRVVKQRPQYDLTQIDAANLTGAEVEERIRANLDNADIRGAIIRQRVINCPVAVRRGINLSDLTDVTAEALVWQPEFIRPAPQSANGDPNTTSVSDSLVSAGTADLPKVWDGWFTDYAERANLNSGIRETVRINGEKILEKVTAHELGEDK